MGNRFFCLLTIFLFVPNYLLFGNANAIYKKKKCVSAPVEPNNIYVFNVADMLHTRTVRLSDFLGRNVVIVNVATYCGHSEQYPALNHLKELFGNVSFDILGFPCNQFGKQEPGANGTEIMNGVKHVRPGGGYEPNFPIFQKLEVNGINEHPLFTFLKKSCPPTRTEFRDRENLFYDPLRNSDIRWNFEKFLVNREGRPVMRYDSSTSPSEIGADIEYLLSRDD